MFNHHVLQLKVLNVIISYLYQTNLCLFFSLVEDIKAMFVCPTAFRFPPFSPFRKQMKAAFYVLPTLRKTIKALCQGIDISIHTFDNSSRQNQY